MFTVSRSKELPPLLIIQTDYKNKFSDEYLALINAVETLEKDPEISKEKLVPLKKSLTAIHTGNTFNISSKKS